MKYESFSIMVLLSKIRIFQNSKSRVLDIWAMVVNSSNYGILMF